MASKAGLVSKGILTGAVTASAVASFRLIVTHAESVRDSLSFPFAVLFALCMYIIICICLKTESSCAGSGIPRVKAEITEKTEVNWIRSFLTMFAGSIASIGAGLSMGQVGPSIHFGAMLSKGISHGFKEDEDLHMTAGAAAGFAAVLCAPVAGVIFAFEEMNRDRDKDILLISVSAAFTSWGTYRFIYRMDPVISFEGLTGLPFDKLWLAVIIGIVTAFIGHLYCAGLKVLRRGYSLISSSWMKTAIPVLFSVALIRVYPFVTGGGTDLKEEMALWPIGMLIVFLVLKMCFTLVSYASGVPGGLIAPVLVLGMVCGCIVSSVTGDTGYVSQCMFLGLGGLFVSVIKRPVTGIVLMIEMCMSLSQIPGIVLSLGTCYLIVRLMREKPIFDMLMD